MSDIPAARQTAPSRVLSVDVLRGLTIALMILVNDPGDGAHTYAQLDHAPWNGMTLTDMVFPTFLFVVGVSIIFSLAGRVARGDSRAALAKRIIRRAISIELIAIFLNLFPRFHWTHLRIFGVLPRIAICYLLVALLCLVTRRAAVLASVAASLVVTYWVLMRFVPVPGFGVPLRDIPLNDPDRNLGAVIDRAFTGWTQHTLHAGHLYERTRDPEGLLSTLPALATTLIGALTGLWLRRSTAPTHHGAVAHPAAKNALSEERTLAGETSAEVQTPARTLGGLVLAAIVCLAIGFAWNHSFPINKKLWTSSYVFAAAGFSLLGLSLCYGLIDVLRLERRSALVRVLLWPSLVFGSNAITAYAMADLIVVSAINIHVFDSTTGKLTSVWGWVYQHIFARGHSTENTSLAFALAYVAVCFLPNLLLWRKRIFLRV